MTKEYSVKTVYVIQPTSEPETPVRQRADDVFEHLIKPVCQQLDYAPTRAAFDLNDEDLEPFVSSLFIDSLVIADLGEPPWDPALILRVGYRMATGRPIVFLITGDRRDDALENLLGDHKPVIVKSTAPGSSINQLVKRIQHAAKQSTGLMSDYAVTELKVPLEDPEKATYIFANKMAAGLFGCASVDEFMGCSVIQLDERLMGFMRKPHAEKFALDQGTLFAAAISPVQRAPVTAKVPLWLVTHPNPKFNHHVYWPILVQWRFDNEENISVVMRVAFVDITDWQHPIDPEDINQDFVLGIPDMFRPMAPPKFDLFLSYNSQDFKYVSELNTALNRLGVKTWFDDAQIDGVAGPYSEIDKGLLSSRATALILGSKGLGRIQQLYEADPDRVRWAVKKRPVVTLLTPEVPDWRSAELILPRELVKLLQAKLWLRLPTVEELRQFSPTATNPPVLLRLIKFVIGMLRGDSPSSDD